MSAWSSRTPISNLPCSSGTQLGCCVRRGRRTNVPAVFLARCEASAPPPPTRQGLPRRGKSTALQIGSPVILVEAPPTLKTAASMPCLRINDGLVKAGDVGSAELSQESQRTCGQSGWLLGLTSLMASISSPWISEKKPPEVHALYQLQQFYKVMFVSLSY